MKHPPANVELDVTGVQGASGDIEIDANGDLTSTILDFTTLNLTPGQMIFIGGDSGTQPSILILLQTVEQQEYYLLTQIWSH